MLTTSYANPLKIRFRNKAQKTIDPLWSSAFNKNQLDFVSAGMYWSLGWMLKRILNASGIRGEKITDVKECHQVGVASQSIEE